MAGEPKHWHDRFQEEFGRESDRAIAIIAAALLEQALETMLRNHMAPCGGQDDPLFDGPYAPLSNFSAKIDVSHRLGLITSRLSRDLHLIRKIRNAFAHNVSGCTFEDAGVRSRVLELTRSERVVETCPDLRERYPAGPKGDFGITVSWMVWWLWHRAERVSPVKPAEDWVPKPEQEEGRTTIEAVVATPAPAARGGGAALPASSEEGEAGRPTRG